jgi:hypothetical protein
MRPAMLTITRYPLLLGLLTALVLWLAAHFAAGPLRHVRPPQGDQRSDYDVVQTATLTLLALIIGFSFSMAISRYDTREQREAQEANTIGTTYLRASLLPEGDAAAMRGALRAYVHARIAYYSTRDPQRLAAIAAQTDSLQARIWGIVQRCAAAQPGPIVALVIASTNDAIDSAGYAQAARSNTIPLTAWALMLAMAVGANLLVGYTSRSRNAAPRLVLPIVVAVAIALVADMDTPAGGTVRVAPLNLQQLARTMDAR